MKSPNTIFKADRQSSCLRFKILLCGRPHWGAWRKDKMKKKVFALIKLLILSLIFIGCASTKINKEKGSDFHLSKYNNIIIFGNFDNYKKDNTLYRDMLESEIKKEFALNKIKSYKSLEVYDFIDFKSDNFEFNNLSNNNDIELLLKITIPSSKASFDSKQVKMETKFDITVFDVKTNQIIFDCSAVTIEKGRDLSDCMNNTFKSLSKKLLRI